MKGIDPFVSTVIVSVMFAVVFAIFLVVMCKHYIKKRKNNVDTIFSKTPVQVTSTTHAVPGGYTVTQIHPTATGYQTQTYSTPYPPQAFPVPMPMPMPTSAVQPNVTQPPAPGIRSDIAPYPTMSAASMNPPPYHVAVTGSAATGVPSRTIYEKQLPYNPNFQM